MNIFILSIILTIVCDVNNKILITFGQYVPTPRYAASSEIIGNNFMLLEVKYRPQELFLHQKYQEKWFIKKF